MSRTILTLVLLTVALGCSSQSYRFSRVTSGTTTEGVAQTPADAGLPARPEEIEFQPLEFTPPRAEEYRRVLPNGVVVYLAPSGEFPLVNFIFTFKGGSYLEPEGKTGLAGITASMVRQGGTARLSAEELDESFDFLAAQVGVSGGDETSQASLNCLTSNLDECFALFMEMLQTPGFQADRLELLKGQILEEMKQRNDSADGILGREWDALLYGRDYYAARVATRSDLDSISTEDLRSFHGRIFHPGNLIVGVSGDFEPQEMIERLEKALEGWPAGERPADPPQTEQDLAAGVYHVEKDIPQGKVFIGMKSIDRDHPDYVPMLLMNNILGGGGFTSRITNRVRTEEGLAYTAGSRFTPGIWHTGSFQAVFQSKNLTVALATKIIFEEFDRIRSQPVSEEELTTAKNSYIERFPRQFESKPAMLGIFINDEWTGRQKDFWQTFRDKVRAVTPSDIQRVAQAHVDPSRMAILVVGKWAEIEGGDLEGRASMKEFFDGRVEHLPLRDPLTQEPLETEPSP